MALYKAQVAIKWTSGLPEDVTVNTFHFESNDSAFVIGTVPGVLENMYAIIDGTYSNVVAQNGHTIKIYSMADPEPRAPIYDGTFNFASAPSGNPLPTEVALCCSYQADRVSGEPQRRRRGRIYLGPFHTGALTTAGRPHADLINDAVAFGNFLAAASSGWTGTKWVVWSEVDASSAVVTNGWVDNAFDTQRRRGVAPTTRTTFDDT